MLKRILAGLAAMMVLCASAALAEELSSLTDRELMQLYLDVMDEMRSRAETGTGESIIGDMAPVDYGIEADEAVSDRIVEFFHAWHENDYSAMVEMCTHEWVAKENENPKNALFSILQNRKPVSLTVETLSGSADDPVRYAGMLVVLEYHTRQDPVQLIMNAKMVREEDGIWYLDPESLMAFKPVHDN